MLRLQKPLGRGQIYPDIIGDIAAFGRSKVEPFVSLHIILGHALALRVAKAERVLGRGKSPVRCLPDPLQTFRNVRGHAVAFQVTVANFAFGIRQILSCGLAIPLHGPDGILGQTIPIGIAHA